MKVTNNNLLATDCRNSCLTILKKYMEQKGFNVSLNMVCDGLKCTDNLDSTLYIDFLNYDSLDNILITSGKNGATYVIKHIFMLAYTQEVNNIKLLDSALDKAIRRVL